MITPHIAGMILYYTLGYGSAAAIGTTLGLWLRKRDKRKADQ